MASGFQGAGTEDLDIYPGSYTIPAAVVLWRGPWNMKQVPCGPQAKLFQLNK